MILKNMDSTPLNMCVCIYIYMYICICIEKSQPCKIMVNYFSISWQLGGCCNIPETTMKDQHPQFRDHTCDILFDISPNPRWSGYKFSPEMSNYFVANHETSTNFSVSSLFGDGLQCRHLVWIVGVEGYWLHPDQGENVGQLSRIFRQFPGSASIYSMGWRKSVIPLGVVCWLGFL